MNRLLSVLAMVAGATFAWGDVKPSSLFSDHMVLQSGMQVPVWGTASPGERVTVKLNEQEQSTTAAADGRWMVRLANLKPGGPYEMLITGQNTIAITDVLIGEVWLGSGQSNMAFTVSKARAYYAGVTNEEQEIAAANYPRIRMFTAKTSKSYEPKTSVEGEWLICNPENVPGFSAVGYFFARDLQKEIKLPVGILTLAFGASTAESWIRRETMAADPQLKPMLDRFDDVVKTFREKAPKEQPPPPPEDTSRPNRVKNPDPVQDQHNATVLYNGMINPVIPYAIRGVIWYQGESIVGGEPGIALYPRVMATLIQDWRKLWGQGDFPFYFVQLAAQQANSNNPRVREAQATALTLPNTGMAVTVDIGEAKNVHPHNKQDVGDRLARIALANVYGRKIEYSGPVYDSMAVEGETVRLKFAHIGSGLIAKDGPLKWFEVAGSDRKFVPADARIDGRTVVLTSTTVKSPVAVRYAWDSYPEGCNLYNDAGLPAVPFRTDKW